MDYYKKHDIIFNVVLGLSIIGLIIVLLIATKIFILQPTAALFSKPETWFVGITPGKFFLVIVIVLAVFVSIKKLFD